MKRGEIYEVLLEIKDTGLPKQSKAQCHQVRTISKMRIKNHQPMGVVNDKTMSRINSALKLHLDIGIC